MVPAADRGWPRVNCSFCSISPLYCFNILHIATILLSEIKIRIRYSFVVHSRLGTTKFACTEIIILGINQSKVITAMVLRPLNDRICCARSAFTHLGIWRKLHDCLWHRVTVSQSVIKCALLTFSSISNRSAAIWKWDFSTPGLRVKGDLGVGNSIIW